MTTLVNWAACMSGSGTWADGCGAQPSSFRGQLASQNKMQYRAVKQELQTQRTSWATDPTSSKAENYTTVFSYSSKTSMGFVTSCWRNHRSLSLSFPSEEQASHLHGNSVLCKASSKPGTAPPAIPVTQHLQQMGKTLLLFMGTGMRPELCTDGNYNSSTERSFKQQLSHRGWMEKPTLWLARSF